MGEEARGECLLGRHLGDTDLAPCTRFRPDRTRYHFSRGQAVVTRSPRTSGQSLHSQGQRALSQTRGPKGHRKTDALGFWSTSPRLDCFRACRNPPENPLSPRQLRRPHSPGPLRARPSRPWSLGNLRRPSAWAGAVGLNTRLITLFPACLCGETSMCRFQSLFIFLFPISSPTFASTLRAREVPFWKDRRRPERSM